MVLHCAHQAAPTIGGERDIGGANLVGCCGYVGDGYTGRKIRLSGDGGINYRPDLTDARDRSLIDAAKPKKG